MTAPTLIVGAGIAGLWTALSLAPNPVILLTGSPLGEGAATGWAQGGIAVAAGADDSVDSHAKDTLAAGAGLSDGTAAQILSDGIAGEIEELRALGVAFETDGAGSLALGLEAAHTHPRIAHIGGDQAGAEILTALIRAVRAAGHIEIRKNWRALALLPARDGSCAGVLARDFSGAEHQVRAADTVLAIGGYGGLFAHTTSPPGATGGAIAMSHRIGADIANPEFVQFHPTAIHTAGDPLPLATEALRGRGARLINEDGESLTGGDDLAPRDIVARAVYRAVMAGRGAYLDGRRAVGQDFPEDFPAVFSACMAAGIDPRRQPIPIVPAAHYTMGGIATDLDGRTSVRGLWSVGECACNGLHGANRLASNSLAEGLVFGKRAARSISNNPSALSDPIMVPTPPVLPRTVLYGLRTAMSRLAGVERDASGLRDLASRVERLAARYGDTDEIITARVIANAALARRESRGGHYRTDFPRSLPTAKNTLIAGCSQEELVAAE
ncbi:L-aspartate oxidase [Hyphobacterium sp.]|uniref:L-aspartate oxidase n=1 Tax=Hyphobacterium sp. TaxID=2004662 RepID=UPI003B5231E7